MAGPNHLLYRECGNVDKAEPTPAHTTRAPASPTTTPTTTTTVGYTAAPDTAEGGVINDDVGPVVTGMLGVSAGVVGVTFGIMGLMHALFVHMK